MSKADSVPAGYWREKKSGVCWSVSERPGWFTRYVIAFLMGLRWEEERG